jgi:hypothetical protein
MMARAIPVRAGTAVAERTTRPMPVDDETRRVLAHAAKIADMCVAARQPMKISGFVARKLSLEAVALELEYGTPRPWAEIMAKIQGRA